MKMTLKINVKNVCKEVQEDEAALLDTSGESCQLTSIMTGEIRSKE